MKRNWESYTEKSWAECEKIIVCNYHSTNGIVNYPRPIENRIQNNAIGVWKIKKRKSFVCNFLLGADLKCVNCSRPKHEHYNQ